MVIQNTDIITKIILSSVGSFYYLLILHIITFFRIWRNIARKIKYNKVFLSKKCNPNCSHFSAEPGFGRGGRAARGGQGLGAFGRGGGGLGLGGRGANLQDKTRLEKVLGKDSTVPCKRGRAEGKGKKGEEKEKNGDPRTGVKRTWAGTTYKGGAKKQFLAPSFSNLGVNKNAYSFYGFFGDKIAQTKNDFVAETHLKFSDDSRINHISNKIPVINDSRMGGVGIGQCFSDPCISATATAWVSGCNTCNLEGGNHGVQSKSRVFFFGDSAIPPWWESILTVLLPSG